MALLARFQRCFCAGGAAVLLCGVVHGAPPPPYVPRYDHVVVAVMENHSAAAVLGNPAAPWINALAAAGANFTAAYGVTHPSQPNYLALFSGSTQGVTDDSCPVAFSGVPNLASQLLAAGRSFAGYSEDLPVAGYAGCSSALYHRRHNPWVDFDTVPSVANQPFSAFPADFSQLPTLAFVVPNLCNDMHDCSIGTGDAWLAAHLDAYVAWARSHGSLFVLVWDEDDYSAQNRIPLIFAGAAVRSGPNATPVNHYTVLRTLEAMHGLTPLGNAAVASPILDVWNDRLFGDTFD